MKTARWVWAVVVLQVLFLLGWAGYHEFVRRTSPSIRLTTLPVDPRDLLRGDYMILNYAISRVPQPVWWGKRYNREVFVVLRAEGSHHVLDTVLAEQPAESEGRLWVRADASSRGQRDLQLNYGIERFFVPEGRGTPSFKELEVEVSVSAAHRLFIRRVWLNGAPFP